MDASPLDGVHPRMQTRFVREIIALRHGNIVRPHLPVNGCCVLDHIPSGLTATLLMDPEWPFVSPTLEDTSGERHHIPFSSWSPGMRFDDLFGSFFDGKGSEWSPIETSVRFEP